MPSVCVFCSASTDVDPAYLKVAEELGRRLAQRGDTLVYGGSTTGLMGAVAQAASSGDGRVEGIVYNAAISHEVANHDADELVVAQNRADRKGEMARRADAFVVLPGGFGTLEEAIEMINLNMIGVADKPVVFVNTLGFFNPLLSMFDRIFERRFAGASQRAAFAVASDPEAAIALIDKWTPGSLTPRWSNP